MLWFFPIYNQCRFLFTSGIGPDILINVHYVPYFVGIKAERWILKRVFQENKARQIFRKMNISYTLIRSRTCAYHGVRNFWFSENLVCLVFLKHLFWDSPFYLITHDLGSLDFFKFLFQGKTKDFQFGDLLKITYRKYLRYFLSWNILV